MNKDEFILIYIFNRTYTARFFESIIDSLEGTIIKKVNMSIVRRGTSRSIHAEI